MADENLLKNISVKITEYDSEITVFNQRWYVHIIFVLLAMIFALTGVGAIFCYCLMLIGVFLLLKRINKKHKLTDQRENLKDELKLMIDKMPMNEYLALQHKIINAGR